MNNNYVPEWKETPFKHIQYTLVRNQDQLDLLFEDVRHTDEFNLDGCDACVLHYDGSSVVLIGDRSDQSLLKNHSILLHEAVHIWQQVRKKMGESEPSKEFEAYSIQAIAQDLFEMFKESE